MGEKQAKLGTVGSTGDLSTPSCPCCRTKKHSPLQAVSLLLASKAFILNYLHGSAPTCPLPGCKTLSAPRFSSASSSQSTFPTPHLSSGIRLCLLQTPMGSRLTSTLLARLSRKWKALALWKRRSLYRPFCGEPPPPGIKGKTDLTGRGAVCSQGDSLASPAGGPPQPVCSGTS